MQMLSMAFAPAMRQPLWQCDTLNGPLHCAAPGILTVTVLSPLHALPAGGEASHHGHADAGEHDQEPPAHPGGGHGRGQCCAGRHRLRHAVGGDGCGQLPRAGRPRFQGVGCVTLKRCAGRHRLRHAISGDDCGQLPRAGRPRVQGVGCIMLSGEAAAGSYGAAAISFPCAGRPWIQGAGSSSKVDGAHRSVVWRPAAGSFQCRPVVLTGVRHPSAGQPAAQLSPMSCQRGRTLLQSQLSCPLSAHGRWAHLDTTTLQPRQPALACRSASSADAGSAHER